MYCVIQKVVNKKPNPYGASKELKVDKMTFGTVGEKMKTKYFYRYSEEKFERPIKTAYKISIHKSFRENGKVKKKQWHIRTIGYYDLIEYGIEDCYVSSDLKSKLDEMDITEKEMLDMIYEKLEPLLFKIEHEFRNTEECKTKNKHTEILYKYNAHKSQFEKTYGSDTYDFCYDVFGELRNEEYLEQLKQQRKAQEEYTKRSYQNNSQSNYNNYSNSDWGSYFTSKSSNYTDDEKQMLKKIYKVAAKKFHPDVSGDDGATMKFLTKLKEQWGI